MNNLAHVGIIVKDVEKSSKFYCEAFQCEVMGNYEDERLKIKYLRAGESVIEFLQYFDADNIGRTAGVIDHIAFYVEDMEKALDRTKKMGIKSLLAAPRDFDGKRIMFVEGIDGERIELVEEKKF